MPPKKERAGKKEIEEIFKKGSFVNSSILSFKYILSKNKQKKIISFIVPKSVAKLAVKRNHLRRAGYGALKKQKNEIPQGIEGVFIFKKNEDEINIIENEIKTIFHKIY